MPTVIIPPTDVSPYTGTGNQVLATNPTFPGIITVNGVGGVNTLKGIVVAGTDIAATDTAAFQVHNNVDDKPMVGFYRGGTLRSVLRLNTDNDFRLLSSNLSTPANLTVGNLTASGASYNDFAGALWLGTTAGYGTLNVGNVSGTGTATYSCLTIGDQSTPANATGLYMRGTSAVCGISTAGAPIAFFTGGPGTSEAARFFNNGNFGIGTGSSDGGQKLQVSGTAALTSRLEINGATGANTTVTRITPSGWNGLTHRYGVQSSGDTTQFSANAAMTAAGTGNLDDTAVGAGVLNLSGASLEYAIATAGTNPRTFSTAFNVDYSGNATFAGKVGIGVSSSSWELNLQQSAVNSAVRIISPTALGLNDSSIYIAWASGSKALIAASYESTGSYRPLVLSAGGVDSLTLDTSGNATFAGTVYAGASSNIGWNGRAYLSALADGKVQVTNWANNGTSMLVLGAAASTSYPMLKRNGTGIDVRLADDSGFATFRALDFSAQGAATTVGANQVSYGGTTATTATAGAQTLPANPVGFIIVNVAGTTAKIPYYAN